MSAAMEPERQCSSDASPSSPAEPCSHEKVSVIIASLGKQPALTRRALEALRRQACSRCEVVIVLDAEASGDFERMLQDFPVRLIKTSRRGQSVAQNIGIRQSDGGIIIPTDDDVVPHDDWLHQLVAGFTDPGIGCVTGRCELGDVGWMRRSSVYSERALSRWTIRPSDPDWVDQAFRGDTGMAANQAFRRAVISQCGLFPEDLSGGTSIDLMEYDTYLKLLRRGHALHHNPEAIVTLYFTDPPEVLKRRIQTIHAGAVALYIKLFLEQKGLRWLIARSFLRSIGRVLRRPREVPASGQVTLPRFQSLLAYLSGPVLYLRSRRDTARVRAEKRLEDSELP